MESEEVKISLRDAVEGGSKWLVLAVCINVGLLVFSHFGTSGVVDSNLSSLELNGRALTESSLCANEPDAGIFRQWTLQDMVDILMQCNLKGDKPCFADSACVSKCVEQSTGLSTNCCSCFGEGSECTMKHCITENPVCFDASDTSCHACVKDKCALSFVRCTGLDLPPQNTAGESPPKPGDSNGSGETTPATSVCKSLRPLYKVQFVDAVKKAWDGGATWLALFLGISSGVWPYVKNLLVLFVWFRPMSCKARGRVLKWVVSLGKWSFVDVFIMILLNATLRIEKLLSKKLVLLVLAYPRPGIYCYCLAAIFSLLQTEWLRLQHEEFAIVLRQRARRVSHSLTNGRLRSNWRRRIANHLVQTKILNRRASLLVRLLVPAFSVLCLVIGFYGFNALELELKGTAALLPGNNIYRYSLEGMMRSILSPGTCSEMNGSSVGRFFLFGVFFVTVLTLPTVVNVATGLLWVVRARAAVLEHRMFGSCTPRLGRMNSYPESGSQKLAVTVELCSSFACLDVFLVSLLLVVNEIDKVVRAVGEAAQVSSVNVDMQARLLAGGYFAVVATLLFWLTQFFYASDDSPEVSAATSKEYTSVLGADDLPMTTIEEQDERDDQGAFVDDPDHAEEHHTLFRS